MVHIKVSKKVLVIGAVLLLVLIPAAAYAGSLFTDVPDTSAHFDGIKYMKDTGVTAGCGDGSIYCPDDPVTRAQMGTFLYRMSGNDPSTPANVNADTVDGFEASDLVRSAGTQIGTVFGGFSVAKGTHKDFVQVSITAPVAGALLVNGSLNLFCQGGIIPTCAQSNGNVYVVVDGNTSDRQYYAIDGGDSTANAAAWNSSNSGYVPVTAGAHTIALRVDNSASSAGSTWLWSGGLNALFVPFNGTGGTP